MPIHAIVRLGNPSPVEPHKDHETDEVTLTALDGPQVTTVDLHEDNLIAGLKTIADLWGYHGEAPPSWVESDHEGIQALLAEHFACKVGEPADEPESSTEGAN